MSKYKSVLAGAVAVCILLLVYYGAFIINADHISFSPWGDGYKNFYTVAYYLKYDSGAHFTGMNYPYGENVIYTDNQPLTTWLLKPVTMLFPALLNHVQAILVWLLMLGHLLCYYVLYKILRRFNLPDLFAVVFAILITLLSPQLIRLNGHFSLGYTFFVPLLIWWLMNLISSNYSIKYLVLLTALVTGSIFVHPYYFAMSALFIISLGLVLFFRTKGSAIAKLASFTPVVAVVVAFIVFKLYSVITDPVIDRPAFPWGFVASRSTIADILLHQMAFINQGLKLVFPEMNISFHSEGQAYVGIIALLAGALLVLYLLLPPLRKRLLHLNIPALLITLVLASIPVLLFAMAFPFSINEQFEKLLIYAPSTIKQFRAAGRFSWVFFYVICIAAAVLVYRIYISFNKKSVAFSFLTVVVVVWFIDINTTNNHNKKIILTYMANTDKEQDSKEVNEGLMQHGYDVSRYQAIMPIPFFQNGSEKLYIESVTCLSSMQISLATGLPMVAGQMSRTSESISFKLVNLAGGDLIKKEALKLYNSKPLLAMLGGEPANEAERKLIERSKYLFTYDGVKYFEMPISALADNMETVRNEVAANYDKLYNHSTYYSYDSLPDAVYKSFDDQAKDYAVFGAGATYNEEGLAWLYTDTLPHATDKSAYEISIWMYADNRRAAFPVLYITQVDATGKEVSVTECNPKFSTQTFGKWVRTSATFTLENKQNKVFVSGDGTYATYDELIIRPINTTVITHLSSKSSFTYNNFPIY